MDLWTRDTQYDTICMHLKRKYNERFFDTVVCSDSTLLTLARNWCLGRFYVLADALNLMRYSGSATERERERFVGVARTWPGSWPGHACGRRAFGGWVSGLFGGCAVRTGLRVVKRDVDPGRLQVIHCRVIEHVTMARAHVGRERVAHPLAVCADDNSACQAACTHQAYVEYPSLMPQPMASLCVTTSCLRVCAEGGGGGAYIGICAAAPPRWDVSRPAAPSTRSRARSTLPCRTWWRSCRKRLG